MKTLEKVAMLDSLKDMGSAPFGLEDLYKTESIMAKLDEDYAQREAAYRSLSKTASQKPKLPCKR